MNSNFCQNLGGSNSENSMSTLEQNGPAVARALGLSTACEETQQSAINDIVKHNKTDKHSYTEASGGGAVVAPWTLGGAYFEGSGQDDDTSSQDEHTTKSSGAMTSSGCTTSSIDIKNVNHAVNNIACSITNNKAESIGKANGSSSIKFKINDDANARALFQQKLDYHLKTLKLLRDIQRDPLPYGPLTRMKQMKLNNQLISKEMDNIHELDKVGDIDIANAVIRADASVDGQMKVFESSNTTQAVSQQLKDIAKLTAENAIKQKLGISAIPPDSRTFLSEKVEEKIKNLDAQGINTSRAYKLEEKVEGVIEISSPGHLTITGSNFSADTHLSLQLGEHITQATNIGIETANEIFTESHTKMSVDKDSYGLEAAGFENSARQPADPRLAALDKLIQDHINSNHNPLMETIMVGIVGLLTVAIGISIYILFFTKIGSKVPNGAKYTILILLSVLLILSLAYVFKLPPFKSEEILSLITPTG